MSTIAPELPAAPDVIKREGEALYRWGDTLGVIVLASGEIGQFATSLPWTRTQVVDFLASQGVT